MMSRDVRMTKGGSIYIFWGDNAIAMAAESPDGAGSIMNLPPPTTATSITYIPGP